MAKAKNNSVIGVFSEDKDEKLFYYLIKSYFKLIDLIYKFIISVSIICLIVLFLSVLFQVVCRVIGEAFLWTGEVARFSFIWLTFLGAAVGVKDASHFVVKIIADKLSNNYKKYLNTLIYLLILLIASLYFFKGIHFTIIGKNRIATSINITLVWVYLSIPVSGFCMFLFAFGNLIKEVLNIESFDNKKQ